MSTTETVSYLSREELEQIRGLAMREDLFASLESKFSLTLSQPLRNSIVEAIERCAEGVKAYAEHPTEEKKMISSFKNLLRPFNEFLDELLRQEKLDQLQVGREGYERIEEHLKTQCWHLFLPTSPDDDIDRYVDEDGNISEAGRKALMPLSMRLEDLRELAKKLAEPIELTARIKKKDVKELFFAAVSPPFVRAGGRMSAYYNPDSGKIEGPFVQFCIAVADMSPKYVRTFLLSGLRDAIRDWLRFIGWSKRDMATPDLFVATPEEFRLNPELMHVEAKLKWGSAQPGAHLECGPELGVLIMQLPPNAMLVREGDLSKLMTPVHSVEDGSEAKSSADGGNPRARGKTGP